MKKLRIMLSVATVGLAAVAFMVACSDDDTTPAAPPAADAAPQVDAAPKPDAAPVADAAPDAPEAPTTGDVTGTITYTGDKKGPSVVALIEKVPTVAGGDTGKLGGFAVVNATTYPATYTVKGQPGDWYISAYMSVGEPPHLTGPLPGDPLDPTPAKVTVVAGQTTPNVAIDMIDLPTSDPDAGDGG